MPPEYLKQKLTELEGELGNSPIILGDFSAPRSIMDEAVGRTSTGNKRTTL